MRRGRSSCSGVRLPALSPSWRVEGAVIDCSRGSSVDVHVNLRGVDNGEILTDVPVFREFETPAAAFSWLVRMHLTGS